ncbi:MAG TPA: response regulator [Desulfobulbus sp.]|nr:response regulator [Desulfobulbus sp.]
MTEHRVLVVDNSPVILKIVSKALEDAGCSVQTAGDGLEALDMLMEFPPDILFTDLVMPKIDGAKLCHIVRNTPGYEHIFLVVLSGIALEDDMNVLELGADICIAKGPAATMKKHILAALERFESGLRGSTHIEGLQGLYPREVTSELLVNKRHNEVIFERMTEGAFELDGFGRIVRANPVCCRLFTSSEAEILGTRLVDLLPEDHRLDFLTWIDTLSSTRTNAPLVFDYSDPVFLGPQQVTFNLVPIYEEGQLSVIGIMKDVTERKRMDAHKARLEKELQRISKLDAMATMAGGIAHDFNNLLTIINGNVEMARILSLDEKVNQLLAETGKALQLTTGLIRRFSTFSDNYLPSKSLVCVDELLSGLLDNELGNSDVEVQLTSDGKVSYVDLDVDLMIQVFQNIILNAVEAMQGKGRLSVDLAEINGREEAEKTGQPIADGKFIRIRITDTGCGMDEAILERIFDAYFSTKQKGTQKGMGLGLTIAHAIVKKHGGLLRINSKPDAGCTATIYLPVGRGAQRCVNGTAGNERLQVLIMDDDEVLRKVFGGMFEECNCDVTTVDSGEEVVREFDDRLTAGRPYDLVLLDLQVKKGLDGVGAAKAIAERSPAAMLVAMSEDGAHEVMHDPRAFYCASAVEKPFSIDTVKTILNDYVRANTK